MSSTKPSKTLTPRSTALRLLVRRTRRTDLPCAACGGFRTDLEVVVDRGDGEAQVGLHKQCVDRVRARRAERAPAKPTLEVVVRDDEEDESVGWEIHLPRQWVSGIRCDLCGGSPEWIKRDPSGDGHRCSACVPHGRSIGRDLPPEHKAALRYVLDHPEGYGAAQQVDPAVTRDLVVLGLVEDIAPAGELPWRYVVTDRARMQPPADLQEVRL
jgi:hypothetical protein